MRLRAQAGGAGTMSRAAGPTPPVLEIKGLVRRYATLVAFLLETSANFTDE